MNGVKRLAGPLVLALVIAGPVAGCGGGDESDGETTTAEPITLAGLTECFEDAGQRVREIETSFSKEPPDAAVEGKSGSAFLWVADDAAELERIKANERKMDYGEGVDVDNLFVESGNALAELSPSASPDYRAVLEECLPGD